jgi:acyl-homoserine-lactone acylase
MGKEIAYFCHILTKLGLKTQKEIMKILQIFILSITAAYCQIDPTKIQIARDKWGVPHIFAKTDAEVAYGLAFAHCEDDFKTIQLTILAGSGMLGQHLGKKGAAADYTVSLIHAKEIVEEKYNTLSPEYIKLIEGYCAGLNAFAASHPDEIFVKKAFPVTVKRYLAGTVLSLSIISGLDRTLGNILAGRIEALEEMKIGGSNAIAIHPSKTVAGDEAYLAINSHQPLEGPVAWYEAHICSEEGLNVLGGLFPAGPVIFVGVNEKLGWGHTVNGQDKIDVYQLKMNPANKNQYEFDGKWIDLEQKKVKMKVKTKLGKIPVSKVAYWSKYGATLKTDKGFFSVRLGANMDIRGVEQWYRMNKAQSFGEFYKAMEMTAIPGFNTFFTSPDTIFYVSNGKIPFRDQNYDWSKTLPGNTSKTLWTDFHPVKDLPTYLNPTSGYLFNANNTPFNASSASNNLKAENFDKTMGYETFDNNRSARLTELFNERPGKVSYEDFKRIKYDAQFPAKFHFPTNIDSLFLLDETKNPEIAELITTLKTWDHNTEIESKGAAIFSGVFYHILNKYRETGYDRTLTSEDFTAILKGLKADLIQHFGKTDITLSAVQKLVRGDKELPISGMADVLRAMYTVPHKNGTRKGYQGESYIAMVKFKKNHLPEIESVINYGASNHPENPHYADQMEMFTKQQLKPMTLDKATVLKNAERVYSPK